MTKKCNTIFIETHSNFHPYACGGVEEGCVHCLAHKNGDNKHINNCALCEDGYYWDKPETKQTLYRK